MTKSKYLLMAIMLWSSSLFAQDNNKEGRTATHYIGIQANQLIRQLLNFGGSSSVATSPYLLVWSVNSKQTGWGFATGLGYTHSEVKSGDPITPLTSTINDFFFRMGFEKRTMIGKRWMLGSGLDVVIESSKDETKTASQFGGNEILTKESGAGFGPRITLSYMISERILIGTEASYYYKSIKSSQKLDGVEQGDSDTLNQLQFNVPAVIYLVIKSK